MAFPNLSFVVGVIILVYLSTFVVFAILRVLTGVSIQRLGFSGLRRISYTRNDGLKIEARGFRFKLHRPTFAQPTWISLILEELKVTLDLDKIPLNQEHDTTTTDGNYEPGAGEKDGQRSQGEVENLKEKRKRTWIKLSNLKDKVKQVHEHLQWVRLVDLVALRTSFVVIGAGTVHFTGLQLSVDTRRTTVDRSRLFQHNRTDPTEQQPAEWTFSSRSILFTPEGKDSIEILDHLELNVHGFLVQNSQGLRDMTIYIKLGRLNVPYDDLMQSLQPIKIHREKEIESRRQSMIHTSSDAPSPPKYPEELLAIPEAHALLNSVLKGVREISFAVGFFGLSKSISGTPGSKNAVHVNMSMKEFGLDVHRLQSGTPAQSMYFARKDVAHQALCSAISISLGLDDGQAHPERLLYVPMSTATIRTTLPSKALQYPAQNDPSDRNSNVFFGTLVVTSPSVDFTSQYLPNIFAMRDAARRKPAPPSHSGHQPLLLRLLPKSSIKLSVTEPVLRMALPHTGEKQTGDFDFNLLVSTVSSMSVDLDSFHQQESDLRYSLSSVIRLTNHRLYYQTTSRVKHDYLINDILESKIQAVVGKESKVSAAMNIQTLSIFLIRPEIIDGIREFMQQFHKGVKPDKLKKSKKPRGSNPLRSLPPWLQHIEISATDLNLEVAGVDAKLSEHQRGFILHLDGWTAEYRAHKEEVARMPTTRRRGGSKSNRVDETLPQPMSPQPKKPKPQTSPTDGRRLAVHFRGLDAFLIESATTSEQDPFLSMPRSEIALTTSSDSTGPVLHVNSSVKSLYMQYSLFRHYCVGVAVVMLQKTFMPDPRSNPRPTVQREVSEVSTAFPEQSTVKELVAFDLSIFFAQIKARLPSDPYLMIHIHEVVAARHRWTTPYVQADVLRIFAESPVVHHTWSRMVSFKEPRIDLRDGRKIHGSEAVPEKSIDVNARALRIGIPHQMVVHKIFDNLANTIKTVAQLHHRFATDSDEYILAKHPEGPKKIPKVSFKTRLLLFEIEDGAFEWKLGAIYRAGLIEQKQRRAREVVFNLKKQKIEEERLQNSSRLGSSSARNRDRSPDKRNQGGTGSYNSAGDPQHSGITSTQREDGRLRYDKDGKCNLSGETQTTIEDAYLKLQKLNAQTWKRRVDKALSYQAGAIQDMRAQLWGLDHVSDEILHDEVILQTPSRPALMGILISDFSLNIDKTSFPAEHLPDFMHRVGKGLPKDTKFGLLVPMHTHFEMGETRFILRDYPLPLLHIPSLKPGQSSKLSSWSMDTDFVIAEEFRDFESTRDIEVMVIPQEKLHPDKRSGAFAVDVRRTVSPVKTYSDMKIEIHTARDTRFTWGASYQPAIQDMMQVIEGFSKPQVDPSERVGFWDKIRLSFHSRVNVSWTGDGDVHCIFKGTRDPYTVTGHGAGLDMAWRNNVQLNIWRENDPMKFMTVDSGEFILAVPDFSQFARNSTNLMPSQAQEQIHIGAREDSSFKKVVMKLSGKVRWQAGLMFEREIKDGKRSFEFEPHYNVTLRNPQHIKSIKNNDRYDAFEGFRSNHIHMSIAISAPSDRDWNMKNLSASDNYNSVHLTPRFFTHFYAWWDMFSGAMSLPVHQGPLFPGIEKSGKKFGRHLATIKYSLLLSPLFISHIYKHKDAEDFNDDVVAATGLKLRLDSFMLDLHQRREEFKSEVKGLNKTVTTTGMRIYRTLLDLVSADIRAVSAAITGTSAEAVKKATKERLAGYDDSAHTVDLSKFTIPDNDFSWVDVDDFVEIDWTLPTDANPETKILPLAYAPRFTYSRQTDHDEAISGDPDRHSPFGYEATHRCIIKSDHDPRGMQMEFIKERLSQIEELIKNHVNSVEYQELQTVKDPHDLGQNRRKLEEIKEHDHLLRHKRRFLRGMLQDLHNRIKNNNPTSMIDIDGVHGKTYTADNRSANGDDVNSDGDGEQENQYHDTSTLADPIGDFNNRFVIHNAQIKWNNSLRNIMLRYFYQVSQRRGFVYYTSRRAVKFILDIVEEQAKAKGGSSASESSPRRPSTHDSGSASSADDDELDVQARIRQLVEDSKKFVNADDPVSAMGDRRKSSAAEHAREDVAEDFTTQNAYHVRLVAPQVQLQSEKNTKAAVLLTARSMLLKVLQIMDKDRVSDDVSGLVQRRFTAEMDNLQFFVTSKHTFTTQFLYMYTGNQYGNKAGSMWPPWVPIEVMFDFSVLSYGFTRVVQRTSASLRYDKYNKLRLKYNDNVSQGQSAPRRSIDSPENRMDQLWVNFPHVRAICDSNQYYAMYIIVLDLLMWSEPLEKVRNERLEKIMLASDFSDLRGAPELVTMLQARIRHLDEIKLEFHINEHTLDRKGWEDRISLAQDLANCEDELFFMMKAITTSQRKPDERTDGTQVSGLLKWYLSADEIVWHLTKDDHQPLVEFQLNNALFERTDNSDGSNRNAIEIARIYGINLLPNAVYPEIIAAYIDTPKNHLEVPVATPNIKMLRVDWLMLEAIAGIPVVDFFEVNMHPLKIQLEYQTGKEIFNYIFPEKDNGEQEASPLVVKHHLPRTDEAEEDDSAEEARANSQKEAAAKDFLAQQAREPQGSSLRPRLQPTHRLSHDKRPEEQSSKGTKNGMLGIHLSDVRHKMNFLSSSSRGSGPTVSVNQKRLNHKQSAESMASSFRGRTPSVASSVNTQATKDDHERRTRFGIPIGRRSASTESRRSKNDKEKDANKKADDLSQMLNRASNYITLAYVKIPSVVLNLSYKGKGSRNIEDVHSLVFRMPTLEYRNKTWSNLDLALALKKDVIRALISHTGAIIGNKLGHHKQSKATQSRLRDLANSSVMLRSNADVTGLPGNESAYDAHFANRNGSVGAGGASPRVSDVTDESGSIYMHDNMSYTSSVDYSEQPHSNEGSGPSHYSVLAHEGTRAALTRHFSELTQLARPSHRREKSPGIVEEGEDSAREKERERERESTGTPTPTPTQRGKERFKKILQHALPSHSHH